jgi:divalent metal cation (Fe/Co/Zn/Cd) transporter
VAHKERSGRVSNPVPPIAPTHGALAARPTSPPVVDRQWARRRARTLSWITVVYNVLEGVVAVAAGGFAGSAALVGFGLDSFIESLSATVMLWRFRAAHAELSEADEAIAEGRALRAVAITYFLLAAYVVWDAGGGLLRREAPEATWYGLAIAGVSLTLMPALFWMKYRLGKAIGSHSLVADAKQSLACMFLSVALLIGLGLHYWLGLWWADSAAALVIAALVLREGWGLWRGEHACGCGVVSIEDTEQAAAESSDACRRAPHQHE